jgi:hypothetical protein
LLCIGDGELGRGGYFTATTSISPEILESSGRQSRIDRRARDRAMTEPSLDRPGVVPLIGEHIAAGVAKHVRVRLEPSPGDASLPLGALALTWSHPTTKDSRGALEETSERDSTASGEARHRPKPRPTIPGPEGRAAHRAMHERHARQHATASSAPRHEAIPRHSHKRGLELITPGTDLQWMGGKKT